MSDPIIEPRVLEPEDVATRVWKKLSAHMHSELQALRERNDTDLDPNETARVRGQIKVLKNLLALETAPADAADEDQPD